MLDISHYQGKTNQNYNEIPPHTCSEWPKLTTQETTGLSKNAEKRESSFNRIILLVGNQTRIATLEKTVWSFLKLKIELPYNPAIALLGIFPKDTKILIWRDTCTAKFITGLSIIAKLLKEPKCPSTYERIKMRSHTHTHTDTHWNITQPLKERNLVICNNVVGARMYYIKWNKSAKERQIPYDLIHKMKEILELRSITTEMKKSLEGFSNNLIWQKKISELQDRTIEIIQSKKQKEKIIMKNKQGLRNLWDNIKCT